jgi:outer membrane immunogenic protein
MLSLVAQKAQKPPTLSATTHSNDSPSGHPNDVRSGQKGLIMKTKILATAALMTLAAIGFANAADLPAPAPNYYKAPPPPPVYNWTGCYIAGGGGYGWWNEDSQPFVTATGTRASAQVTNGGKGWFGIGQGGCDYQFNMPLGSWSLPIVIGAFGDWAGGSIRGQNSNPLAVGTENESSTWAVGGRAGYLVSPRFLTYFDGGFTQARFDQINYNFSGVGPVFGGPSGGSLPAQNYNGWFVGSGFEYAFDWLPVPGLFLKTEYRYSQFNTANPSFVFTATGAPSGLSLNTTHKTQAVFTELVWRFNFWGGRY